MNRDEFFNWLNVEKIKYTKYSCSDYFSVRLDDCHGYEYVEIKVYQDGDVWKVASDNKVWGDRPDINYTLTSREPFKNEEDLLEWLRNKLEIFLSFS